MSTTFSKSLDSIFPSRIVRREKKHSEILKYKSETEKYRFERRKCKLEKKMFELSYDAVKKNRLHKKRSGLQGTGDTHLTKESLESIRNICRDLCRNNPIVRGLLLLEANEVIGTTTNIQARTDDEDWNSQAEELFKQEMVEKPCDVTGRFNFPSLLHKSFYNYRRDGDFFLILSDQGIQLIESDCVGTPTGLQKPVNFEVVNGVAFSKQTGQVIGYYVGKSDKWGYIKSDSYQKYLAEDVIHIFDSERTTQSRGDPVLAPSIQWIDMLSDYLDAELVAAKVGACFSAFITQKEPEGISVPYTGGVSSSGEDSVSGERLEKLSPGTIMYGEAGEGIQSINPQRPPGAFDVYVSRMISFISRPLCIPLMLAVLNFEGATYMNTRVMYQVAQSNWLSQQKFVIEPLVRRIWLWKISQWIEEGLLSKRDDWAKHQVMLKRWKYVDPEREASAEQKQLDMGITTRTEICNKQGLEWKDVIQQRQKEEQLIKELGITLKPEKVKISENGQG